MTTFIHKSQKWGSIVTCRILYFKYLAKMFKIGYSFPEKNPEFYIPKIKDGCPLLCKLDTFDLDLPFLSSYE